MTAQPHILVVDDSVYSRRALKQMIEEIIPNATFSTASAGDEGLQIAFKESPAIIFLDLEMPRMDGFTFLRLLMAKQPTPVIVVSGRNDEFNVLKALELGALDFVSKPTQTASTRIYEIQDELTEKLALIDVAQPVATPSLSRTTYPGKETRTAKTLPDFHSEATQMICIGASTGGPGTITKLLDQLKIEPWTSLVIGQHMPDGFTKAFAQRLNSLYSFPVQEIQHLDRVNSGTVYVCPGGKNTRVVRGRELRWDVSEPTSEDRYVPSIDKLLTSASECFESQCLATILTGMGNDGTAGARAIRAGGGTVLAEDPESAVVFGMPQAVIDAQYAQYVHKVEAIPGALQQWMLGILQGGDDH